VKIFPDDVTNSTKESASQYHSEHDSDVDMHREDTVDAMDGIDSDGDVDMEQDSDNAEEEYE